MFLDALQGFHWEPGIELGYYSALIRLYTCIHLSVFSKTPCIFAQVVVANCWYVSVVCIRESRGLPGSSQ